MLYAISFATILYLISSLYKKKHLFFGVSLFVLSLIPYYRISETASNTHYFQTMMILLVFFLLVVKISPELLSYNYKFKLGPLFPEMMWLTGFSIFFFLIGIYNGTPITNSLGQLFIFIEIVIFYFISYNLLHSINSKDLIDKIVKTLFISIVIGVSLVYIGIFPPTTVRVPQENFRIVLSAPIFAWFVAIFVFQMMLFNRKSSLKMIIILIICLGIVYLSHFRSYWLGFIGSIMFVYILNFMYRKNIETNMKRIMIYYSLMLFGLFVYLYLNSTSTNIFSYGFDRIISAITLQDPSVLTRLEEVKQISILMKENIFWGAGLGAEYTSLSHSTGNYVSKNYIHNIVLFFLYKTGIIGTLLIGLISISIFNKLYIKVKNYFSKDQLNVSIIIFAYLIGLIIASLSEPEIINFLYTPFFGVLLSILSINISKKEGYKNGEN